MSKGDNCRSGCKTRDHGTYGECARDGLPRITRLATPNNSWDRELKVYADARRQGVQPDTTKTFDSQLALEFSDRTGVAYDASDKATTLLKVEGLA